MSAHLKKTKVVELLFKNKKFSAFWLILRLYVGYKWITAGWGKLMSDRWVGVESGRAVEGFVSGAIAKLSEMSPDILGWYASFLEKVVLNNSSLWAHIITYGEIAVGVALVVGAFVGVAAFFGMFMNLNFMMAGTFGINPLLFVAQLFLVFAWRVSGHIGLDRYILPKIKKWCKRK